VKTTKVVKTSTVANTSNLDNNEKTIEEEVRKPNPRVDVTLIGKRSRSQTPHFLLTFEIFNRNVHNCLVDSGASSNVMPYSVCKMLNAQPKMCRTGII
jgi:predicted aspartyl protease